MRVKRRMRVTGGFSEVCVLKERGPTYFKVLSPPSHPPRIFYFLVKHVYPRLLLSHSDYSFERISALAYSFIPRPFSFPLPLSILSGNGSFGLRRGIDLKSYGTF